MTRDVDFVLIGIVGTWIAYLARQLGWWLPPEAMTPRVRTGLLIILLGSGVGGIIAAWVGLGRMILRAERERACHG